MLKLKTMLEMRNCKKQVLVKSADNCDPQIFSSGEEYRSQNFKTIHPSANVFIGKCSNEAIKLLMYTMHYIYIFLYL